MKSLSTAVILILLLLFCGCRGRQPDVPPPVPLPLTQMTQALKPPEQLDVIQANAVDIIEDISHMDWSAAKSKADIIKNSMGELKPILESARLPKETVDGIVSAVGGLDSAVGAGKQYDALAQANMITEFIPDIADYYVTAVPTDIMRLGYLARELMLDVRHEDWQSAETDLTATEGVWIRSKSKLPTYRQDIDEFQNSLDRLRPALDEKDAKTASAVVNMLLDFIDALERDFSEQNKL